MSRSHDHNHSHNIKSTGTYLNRAFTGGIILNLLFVVVEFGAGVALDSVALMSDAGHNLSDVISLGLAMLAFRLSRKGPSHKFTYGRKKSTVLVSFTNACILLVAIGIIVYESIDKLMHPQPIDGAGVAWVAGIGIVINAFTAWLFMRHRHTDLNVKGAYLHMAADTLVSVGVLISGLVIKFTGWYPLDPIIGIVVAIIIFFSTWNLLRDSIRLSLDGVPPGIDFDRVSRDLLDLDTRITDVHHIHIWPLSTTDNALTAHVVTDPSCDREDIKRKIREYLAENNIHHSTLEFEDKGACTGIWPCGCGPEDIK